MTATLTHAVFKVTGESSQLAAFDARLKLLFAEHGIGDEVEEQHAPGSLHYDLKVAGGIPFAPFALASGDFPGLLVQAEWVDLVSGVRGAATIERGALTGQKIESVVGAAANFQVAIRTNADGFLALGMAVVRTGRDECCGYLLTGEQDALFRVTRAAVAGVIDLVTTDGSAEWSRAWRIDANGTVEYRAIEPAQPIADADFSELEKLARDFVAQWIWFGNGPREETAIEAERYARLGYAVSAANLRSAALHRIRGGTVDGAGGIRYSKLDPHIAWVEDAITPCWPNSGGE